METKFTKGEKQLRLSKWFAWYPVNTDKGFEGDLHQREPN